MYSLRLLGLLVMLSIVGCGESGDQEEGQSAASRIRTKQKVTMTETERSTLQSNLATIRIGQTYDQVITILGTPSEDNKYEANRKAPVAGRAVAYIVSKPHEDIYMVFDQYVFLWFDLNDKLVDITLNNLDWPIENATKCVDGQELSQFPRLTGDILC